MADETYSRSPEAKDRWWDGGETPRRLWDAAYVHRGEYGVRVPSPEAIAERERSFFAAALGWPDGKCPTDLDQHLGMPTS